MGRQEMKKQKMTSIKNMLDNHKKDNKTIHIKFRMIKNCVSFFDTKSILNKIYTKSSNLSKLLEPEKQIFFGNY